MTAAAGGATPAKLAKPTVAGPGWPGTVIGAWVPCRARAGAGPPLVPYAPAVPPRPTGPALPGAGPLLVVCSVVAACRPPPPGKPTPATDGATRLARPGIRACSFSATAVDLCATKSTPANPTSWELGLPGIGALPVSRTAHGRSATLPNSACGNMAGVGIDAGCRRTGCQPRMRSVSLRYPVYPHGRSQFRCCVPVGNTPFMLLARVFLSYLSKACISACRAERGSGMFAPGEGAHMTAS